MVKRSIWQYGMFQIPAFLSLICLITAGVVTFLEVGCSSFWIRLFLGLTWIALMWMLVLPLDNLLRVKFNFEMSTAGRLAIIHAALWSFVTLASLVLLILPPLLKSCATTSRFDQNNVILDWASWRANIWNQMFLRKNIPGGIIPGGIGSEAKFSFVVYRDRRIEDIKVEASDSELEGFVISRIESLKGTKALAFIESTRRDQVLYESSITVCRPGSPGCGEPADPNKHPDKESFTRSRSN